jgi:hypothetical protein
MLCLRQKLAIQRLVITAKKTLASSEEAGHVQFGQGRWRSFGKEALAEAEKQLRIAGVADHHRSTMAPTV